ncbi:MAG: hypothetical protein ABIS92_11760 [Polyangia bacterium]
MKRFHSLSRRPAVALLLCACLSATALGCRRPHVEGTVSVESILKKWDQGGFDTKAVVNIEGDLWSAGACSRGPVGGLDVLICEYSSDEAAGVGEKKMLADWDEEGIPTGAVTRNTKTVLAIADRNKADRSGRTVARLGKLFHTGN